jgi:hypothetical protein
MTRFRKYFFRPLQRMFCGMILIVFAFIVAAILQRAIEVEYIILILFIDFIMNIFILVKSSRNTSSFQCKYI